MLLLTEICERYKCAQIEIVDYVILSRGGNRGSGSARGTGGKSWRDIPTHSMFDIQHGHIPQVPFSALFLLDNAALDSVSFQKRSRALAGA
jgi:hypothetical protein